MKRLFATAGLSLLLLPSAAAAAESKVCKALAEVKPVSSHYVQKVLERADKGLGNVRSAKANPTFERYLPSWALYVSGAVNGLVDSYLTLTVAQEDLLNVTSCQRVDTLLIDCKILQVQDELQAQLKKNSVWGLIQAQSLLAFLQERKVHLARGALNPAYEDPTWDARMRFDGAGSSSSASAAAASSQSSEAMCPFDTDYAPPGSDGYGCDLSVLRKIGAYEPAESEKQALETLDKEIDRYKELAGEFESLEKDLDSLYEEGSSRSLPSSARRSPSGNGEHKDLNGCQEKELPEDVRLRSVRSPFSYKKDEIGILSDFLGKRIAEGMFREHSDDLKDPGEFDDDKKKEAAERRDNPLTRLFRYGARSFIEAVSGRQGEDEGSAFAVSPDGTMEIAHSLGDLRQSVGELSRLSADIGGLRSFVIRYAYYLRRSCIYRPCSESLERVLRTAYADECFPYTYGAFLRDSAGDPRWKKCAVAACIKVDGVDLPGSCNEILPEKEKP